MKGSILLSRLLPSTLTSQTSRHRQPSSVLLRICASCFTAIMIAVHYTDYSSLIPIIRDTLHVSSGEVGLFSTLLFLGLAATYIPAGMLADRFGAQPVLIGSSLLLAIGSLLLPLFASLPWMLACRVLMGLGSGGAFVTGAGVAADLGKHASLGQGLYGGSSGLGSGLGLLITPYLLPLFGWRGCFLFWGIFSSFSVLIWIFVNDGQTVHTPTPINLRTATRSPSVWTLGLAHLGTFGLGNAIAAWITIYLVDQYNLSLTVAAAVGALSLMMGALLRPMGGLLLARRLIGAIPLLRTGAVVGCIGVILLAIPLRFPLFAIAGMLLIALGSTTPYASVFNTAANLRTAGKGVAQGLVGVISAPTSVIGPPLIGLLLDRTGSFTFAFGSMLLFGGIAIVASILAGPAVKREAAS